MNRNKSTNSRSNTSEVRVMKKIRKEMSRRERGVKFTPNADPPSIIRNPWNNYTLSMGGTKDTKISIALISTAMKDAWGFDLATSQKLIYRFFSVRIWCITATRPIKASFFSLVGEAARDVQSDFPTRLNFARIGYRWPVSMQQVVFGTGVLNDDEIFTVDVSSDANWIAYLQLCWSLPTSAVAFDNYFVSSAIPP